MFKSKDYLKTKDSDLESKLLKHNYDDLYYMPYIMKILAQEGCGMDCSSYTELMLSAAIDVTGTDIMFSSNVTPAEDYKLACDLSPWYCAFTSKRNLR